MEFLTGIESTYIVGSNRDVMDLSGHTTRVRADLERVAGLGVRTLRFPAPWHKIEKTRGTYDFAWMDESVAIARDLGIELILDLLHHVSFPDWLTGGFLDPLFLKGFLQFAAAVAHRYPHVSRYTVVNEPYVTCWFAGHEGVWHPRAKSDREFIDMMVVVACANQCAQKVIECMRDGPAEFLHTESCEKHFAADRDPGVVGHARRSNQMRFAGHDLVLGMVDREHPLWNYFKQCDGGERDLESLCENPGRIDVLGLDWYEHCSIWWDKAGRIAPRERIGFADVAVDYLDRYGLDCMLSETNIRGTPAEQIAHFNMMVGECERLEERAAARGLAFKGYCHYPLTDCRGWSNLCTRVTHDLDPQGIWSLDDDNERVETEFTRAFRDRAMAGSLVESSV